MEEQATEVETNAALMELEEWMDRIKRILGPYGIKWDMIVAVSELDGDGQMLIRRFIASNKPRKLNFYDYDLSLDSDDRVFVADTENDRLHDFS